MTKIRSVVVKTNVAENFDFWVTGIVQTRMIDIGGKQAHEK